MKQSKHPIIKCLKYQLNKQNHAYNITKSNGIYNATSDEIEKMNQIIIYLHKEWKNHFLIIQQL